MEFEEVGSEYIKTLKQNLPIKSGQLENVPTLQ